MRARGFSLIELVVAMAVSLIAVAAGVALLVASHRSFRSGTDERAVQETARVALDELLVNLRTAGYGLDPTFAFDTGLISDTVMDRIAQGDQARFGGYCGGGTCARDSTSGPDEVVFYARNTLFSRDVDSVGTDTVTLKTMADLSAGQILQIMCYGTNNQWQWAYVTVKKVEVSGTKAKVTLQTGANYDFPYQNDLLTEQTCFQGGTVRAFEVDRFRYHIAAVDAAGAIQDWETPGTRPYLMLDDGLGTERVIAPDVEDLQVAYEFPLAPAGSRLLGGPGGALVTANVDGDDDGFNLKPNALELNFGIPSFDLPSRHPWRTTHHPANIRAVRIAVTVRGPTQDMSISETTVPAVFNRPAVAGEPGYHRAVFESTAYTRNLESRLPVFPTYDQNYATSCCAPGKTCDGNCGGG